MAIGDLDGSSLLFNLCWYEFGISQLEVTMRYLVNIAQFLLFWFLFMVVGGAFLGFISEEQTGLLGLTAVFTLLGAPILAFFVTRQLSRRRNNGLLKRSEQELIESERAEGEFARQRFLERERILSSVDKHRAAISRNILRATKKNDYGVVVEDTSSDAISEFLYSVSLDQSAFSISEAELLVREHLDKQVETDTASGFDSSAIPADGHAFEEWVAQSLERFGWEAEVTSAGGDQGIDVIASFEGKRIGIQCKLYTGSVGNKAVQEAHAGKSYYGLDKVAVLTNSEFTRSARELAEMTDVILLSQHDIPHLHTYL